MPRTNTRYEGDQAFGDGQVFLSAFDAVNSGAGTVTYNGTGIAIAASQVTVLNFPLSKLLFRYGAQDAYQEQFGSAQAGGAQGLPVGGYTTTVAVAANPGSNVSVQVLNSASFTPGRKVLAGTQATVITSIPDATHIVLQTITATLTVGTPITENLFTTPAGVTGPPPYLGMSQLTPVTAPRPKGISIRQIYPVYTLSAVNAALNTIGITKTQFSFTAAPVTTNLLTSGANGLATAFAANPYMTPIQIPSPVMLTSKYAAYNLAWNVSTAAGGTATVYGIFMDIAYNWS